MIVVEDDQEGRQDNKSVGSRKPQNDRRRWMSNHDVVRSLRDMMQTLESPKCMTAAVEDMEVGNHEMVRHAGHRKGVSWNIGMAV